MIVLTAPTSSIGSQVLDMLLSQDAAIRVIARDPARLPAAVRDRVEVVVGSHADPDVVTAAFDGADTVFLLVPADPAAPSLKAAYLDFVKPACAAITERKVRRVVQISALGRGTAPAGHAGYVTASLAMDDLLAATGVDLRVLAMPSFMENLLFQLTPITEQGMWFGPIPGDHAAPSVATRDIAAVAARLLLEEDWTGQAEVPVLGPADISADEMAQVMTEVLGTPVRYQQIPAEGLKAQLVGSGTSEAMAQGMVEMMLAKAAGLDNGAARTPEASTPTTFRQWCEEVLKPAANA